MEVPLIDLKTQYDTIKLDIDKAIQDVLDGGRFIGGDEVREFEREFAKKANISHCISTANGTDAIYIALRVLGIGKGNEVVTTSLSWLSTASTILQVGATPIFVDIELGTGLIDTSLIESKITANTKAIIPVHLHGQMADINAIKMLCDKHGLYCIEDSAQAHFASIDDVMPGQLSDFATFSFYPTKNLGAYGDAGCIVTDNEELSDNCRSLADYGSRGKGQNFGINSRLDTIQAAILKVKLRHIDKWITLRRKNATKYNELLKDLPQVSKPIVSKGAGDTFYTYTIRCNQRNELQKYLKEHGIDSSIHYPTILPLLPLFYSFEHKPEDFPVAFKYQNETLSLPVYAELSNNQIEYVANCIRDFYN